jgi:hypothetical protein
VGETRLVGELILLQLICINYFQRLYEAGRLACHTNDSDHNRYASGPRMKIYVKYSVMNSNMDVAISIIRGPAANLLVIPPVTCMPHGGTVASHLARGYFGRRKEFFSNPNMFCRPQTNRLT